MKIRDYLDNQLTLEEVLKEYESLSPEEEIAKKIAMLRQEKELTQKQLSQLTGIDQADISKIESGNRTVSIKLLKKIADAFDMKLIIDFEQNDE